MNTLYTKTQDDSTALSPKSPSFGSPPGLYGLKISSSHKDLVLGLAAVVLEKIGDCAVEIGGYSDVWKARLITNPGGVMSLVALKVLRTLRSDQEHLYKRFEHELKYWEPLDHENIAPFQGVHIEPNGLPAFILPWYENGSADVYLRNHPSVGPMHVILGIASALEYLHSKNIVHGDLKGANVMIDDAGQARLIDFGLARSLDTEDDDVPCGTTSSIRWCAPELRRCPDARTTKASDVYAFASTVLELMTGAIPYAAIPKTAVYRLVINGVSPRTLSRDLRYDIARPDLLWRLLARCWAELESRPSIADAKRDIYPVFGA